MAARKRQTLRSMDDVFNEMKMLPGDLESIPEIIPSSPIEGFFIESAFKHGVIDSCLDDQYNDAFYEDLT